MKVNRPYSWRFFGLFTAVGLLFFLSGWFDDLARNVRVFENARFVEEMTGSYTVLVLFPLVRLIFDRSGFMRRRWWRALPLLAGGMVAYTCLHTTLMAVSRSLLFPLLGWGAYDYGLMIYRYPMEGAKDVIAYSLIVASFVISQRVRAGRQAELDAAGLQAQLAEARIENLQLQLQPHFLFNTLNAISAVMYEDVAKADAMLVKLSDFLRTVLDSSGVHRVPVAEEMRVERLYVDIMRARLERALELRITVADDASAAEIPFMLLQPLLENSIRHGLAGDHFALDIDVDVSRASGDLVIEVNDNGAGFAPGERRGYGLRNVESRLRQSFGAGASFSIGERAGGGTRVRLSYPFPEFALP